MKGILRSLVLPHCWVCGSRFNDLQENAGPAMREEHHVIPRAYGGEDGPTVSLCDLHHATLHKIAVCMKTSKPYHQYTLKHSVSQKKKLIFLASKVYEAEQLTRNDPNKRTMLTLSLDGEMTKMIDDLKTVLPGVKSREAVARSALIALWNRHFMGPDKGLTGT